MCAGSVSRCPRSSTRGAARRCAASIAREHAVELPLVDHRAEIVLVAPARRGARRRRSTSCVAELVVDRVEHDDPAARRAALPGVAEGRQHRPLHGRVEIRVVADDERVLAAELQRDPREPARRRRAAIRRPTAVEPVKLTTPTSGCATSGAPASAPSPGRRSARRRAARPRARSAANSQAVAGVSSAAFSTAALPQTSAGKHLPGHVGDRRVGGDDQPGHADRLRARSSPTGPALPLVVVRPYSRWPSPAKNRPSAMAPSVSPRASFGDLPVSSATTSRELLAAGLHARGDRVAGSRRAARRALPPSARIRRAGRRDRGAAYVGLARAGYRGRAPAVVRVELGERLARRRPARSAPADPVRDTSGRAAHVAHHAVQPPSITRLAPVMYDEASEQRKTTAPLYSSARAIRPSGTRAQ